MYIGFVTSANLITYLTYVEDFVIHKWSVSRCWINIRVTGLDRAPRASPHGLVLVFTYYRLMFRARTSSIRYKYGLYFTDTLLVCANSTCPVVVRQTEELPVSANPLYFSTPVRI
jgi:hypothetical protein